MQHAKAPSGSHLAVAAAPQRPVVSTLTPLALSTTLNGPSPAIPTLRHLQNHHQKVRTTPGPLNNNNNNNNNNKVTVNNNYKPSAPPHPPPPPTPPPPPGSGRTVPPVVLKLNPANGKEASADQPLKRTYSVSHSVPHPELEPPKKKRKDGDDAGDAAPMLLNGSITTPAPIPTTSVSSNKRSSMLTSAKMLPQALQGVLAQHILQQQHLSRSSHPAMVSSGKADMISVYQPWVILTYGDMAKTKTITLTKYARIVRTLRGEEPNSADNSKFRFWVRSKGFRLGQPEGYVPKPADGVTGSYGIDTRTNRLYVRGPDDPSHTLDSPPLYVPTATVKDDGGRDQPMFKKVAVVENFFDIIYSVHVDIEGRGAKHAGQKRTYRTITDSYAFLPREAVTKFLLGCTECQRRPRSPSSPLGKTSPCTSPCASPTPSGPIGPIVPMTNGISVINGNAPVNGPGCAMQAPPPPGALRSPFLPPPGPHAFPGAGLPPPTDFSMATGPILSSAIASNPILNARLHSPYQTQHEMEPPRFIPPYPAFPPAKNNRVSVLKPSPKAVDVPSGDADARKAFPIKIPEPAQRGKDESGVFTVPTAPGHNSAFSVQNLSTSSRKECGPGAAVPTSASLDLSHSRPRSPAVPATTTNGFVMPVRPKPIRSSPHDLSRYQLDHRDSHSPSLSPSPAPCLSPSLLPVPTPSPPGLPPHRQYSLLRTLKSQHKHIDHSLEEVKPLACPLRPLESVAPRKVSSPADAAADLSGARQTASPASSPPPSPALLDGKAETDSDSPQDLSMPSSSLLGGCEPMAAGGGLLNLLVKSGVLRNGGPRTAIPEAQGIDFSMPITTTYLKHMRSLGYSDEDALKIDVEVSLYQHVLGVPLRTVDDYL